MLSLSIVSFLFILSVLSVSFVQISESQLFRPGYEPQSVINSLLTPILPRSECTATADNRIGLCMPKAACVSSGGYVTGTCKYVQSCCVYQGTCRSVITANETYFVSPQYPALHSERLDPPYCIFTLQRNSLIIKWPVCQIRLDFDEFSLAPPVTGNCGNGQTDSFIVSGATNFNQSGLPEGGLCGELTGQHIYLDVNPKNTDDPLLLIVNTANEQQYNRKWSIRIQQVPCQSPFRAPSGCLQHFTTETGTVESLNFRGIGRATPVLPQGQQFPPNIIPGQQFPPNIIPGQQVYQVLPAPNYYNYLHYGICIAKQPRMCAIRWQAVQFDFGGRTVDMSSTEGNCVDYGTGTGEDTGDFIIIPASSLNGRTSLLNRYCGQRLNPDTANTPANADVLSYMKPFQLFVHSDSLPQLNDLQTTPKDQKGFQLKYQQISC